MTKEARDKIAGGLQEAAIIAPYLARIEVLEALVKELADELQVYICAKYVGRKGCPKSRRDEYDAAAEPVRKARDAISVNNQVKFDSSLDSTDLRAARAALGEKE